MLASADELFCFGTVAAGHLQRGEITKALSAADRGFGLLRKTDIVWGNYVYGASGVVEVYLACWSPASSRGRLSQQGPARLRFRKARDAQLAGLSPALATAQRTGRASVRQTGARPPDVDAGPGSGRQAPLAQGEWPCALRDRSDG